MGNVLADYEDGGGVVVVGDAAWYNYYHWYREGRWMFDGYSPYVSRFRTSMILIPPASPISLIP